MKVELSLGSTPANTTEKYLVVRHKGEKIRFSQIKQIVPRFTGRLEFLEKKGWFSRYRLVIPDDEIPLLREAGISIQYVAWFGGDWSERKIV